MNSSTHITDFGKSPTDLCAHLESGEIKVLGRVSNSSNTTLLVDVTTKSQSHLAIYKPVEGERPLHDFPPGLHKREVAAYELAKQIGWSIIPPTVLRKGPFGEGSVQAFVDADFSQHYFTLMEDGLLTEDLKKLCVLDYVMNNTDRKSGHCLISKFGNLYGIDNGLSFHYQFKLRTVIWDFADIEFSSEIVDALETFMDEGPCDAITQHLENLEVDALKERSKSLLANKVFPADDTGGRRWPWPPI